MAKKSWRLKKVFTICGYSNLRARGKNFQIFMFSKKKSFDLGFQFFSPKVMVSSKKKVFTLISSVIFLFSTQNQGVLQKEKKVPHLKLVSDSPLFVPKSQWPLKFDKKREKRVFTANLSSTSAKIDRTEGFKKYWAGHAKSLCGPRVGRPWSNPSWINVAD